MTEPPTGWTWETLGEVATWSSGGTPKSGTPSYYGGTIPWAVIGDLDDATVIATAATVTAAGLANSSAKVVEPGTVLVAMYGSIGKLGIAGIPMATNQAIACAVPSAAVSRDVTIQVSRVGARVFGRVGVCWFGRGVLRERCAWRHGRVESCRSRGVRGDVVGAGRDARV